MTKLEETALDHETAKKRHEQCSKDIRRVGFSLLTFALFSLLTLGQPDEVSLKSGGAVRIPFAGTDITFGTFLLLGPVLLLLMVTYLQIFVVEWKRCEPYVAYENRAPFAFNLDHWVSRWTSVFVFYVLPNVLLALFFFKARAWSEMWICVLVFGFSSVVLSFLFFRTHCSSVKWMPMIVGWSILILICSVLAWPGQLSRWVPLNLAEADLHNEDLSQFEIEGSLNCTGANFRNTIFREKVDLQAANCANADLRGASLVGAVLEGADLRGTKLTRTNLSQANLVNVILHGANLEQVILRGAVLVSAEMDGVDLSNADLGGADLEAAFLEGANLTNVTLTETQLRNGDFRSAIMINSNLAGAKAESADFSGARLNGSDLNNSSIRGAKFLAAKLDGANLQCVDFESAIIDGSSLRGADLRKARNLTQDQLDTACGNELTKTSEGQKIRNCSVGAPRKSSSSEGGSELVWPNQESCRNVDL